jgi:plasmid maintenance system killer protein
MRLRPAILSSLRESWLRVDDVAVPAGNRLELLKGDRAGRHSWRALARP